MLPPFLHAVRDVGKGRWISLVVLLFSLGCHVVAALEVLPLQGGRTVPFLSEYLFCLGVSAALEIACFAIRGVVLFRVFHVLRFLILFLAFRIMPDAPALTFAGLLMPFLAETALYDDRRIALAANAIFLVAACTGLAVRPRSSVAGSLLPTLLPFALATSVFAGMASLLTHYREAVADKLEKIRYLDDRVLHLMDANRAFQSYAGNVESETAEKERNLITRELHDLVGYNLTNVIVMMNAGRILLKQNPEALDEILVRVGEQTEKTLNDTRQILHRLRAVRDTKPTGLRELARLAKGFEGATGIRVRVEMGNLPWTLGQTIDSILYRFVQEGLTNAFRHGKAVEVRVMLWRSEQEIRVTIRDDGQGSGSDATIQEGIGLAGMRERFVEVGGSIQARNVAGGFELSASIPYVRRDVDG